MSRAPRRRLSCLYRNAVKPRPIALANRCFSQNKAGMQPNLPPEAAAGLTDPATRFGRLISAVYREWRRQVDLVLQDMDLSEATRMPLLVLLDHGSELRQKDLAQALAIDSSSLFRVLNALRRRGYLDWTADPCDRRAKLIRLTAKGHEIAHLVRNKSLEIEEKILAGHAPADMALTRAFLEHLLERLRKTAL